MSIFTPSIYNEPSFSGLFRLLDDFDNYRASTSAGQNNQQQQIAANGSANANQQRQLTGRSGGLLGQMSFSPRFDLRETDTAFELRGDLPGVDKNQVHVEFADEHTLTIRGRVEREWSSSSSSSGGGGNDNTGTSSTEKSADAATTSKDGEKQASSASTSSGSVQQQQQQPQTPAQAKYWITERSVGEFSRSFRLTGNHHHHGGPAVDGDVEIDHDGVTAKLDNGVLSVVVPKIVKEKKQAARKVQIH